MGFGHRIYKVRDPRADILASAAERLHENAGDTDLYELALHIEKAAVALLEEYKPGRNLQTNVEFYTALLLHGVGLPTELFTPTFAIGRTAGWTAHCIVSGNWIRSSAPSRAILVPRIGAGFRSKNGSEAKTRLTIMAAHRCNAI